MPATSVSLDAGKIAWGSESGVYYWDGASYVQISGSSLANGFSPAADFVAASDYSPTTSVSLEGGAIAWGSESGVYYWDGASYVQISGSSLANGFSPAAGFVAASDYSPTTSVSLDGGTIGWGSASGVYYWNGSVYIQISGYTETAGFSPAPGFVATSDYSPTTSVSLGGGAIGWGSASGVYHWNGSVYTQISGYTETAGFSPAPGFVATIEYAPATSVSLDGGAIGWGSASGVYYWDGNSSIQIGGRTETAGFSPAPGFVATTEYAPATSVSLDGGELGWGSAAGVYYWDQGLDTPYRQISGYFLTTGFSPAPGFMATNQFSAAKCVSLDDGKIAWGSAAGVYCWDEASITAVSDLVGVEKGDVNGDGNVDLADAIFALRILVGLEPAGEIRLDADVNGDSRIGLEEIFYIMGRIAGLRS
ncbi:MAG: dockerin type I repeat-containing protein [Thermodesulfobacteriota bacterium]|nr:dockerin type I repeat-containing protein [Thermodesulfobacteriota bacterium]